MARIEPEVADILHRCRIEGNNLYLPPVQLERKLYERVAKVLGEIGGKWHRGSQSHVFKNSPADAIATALDTGRVVSEKKVYQAFYTPPELARIVAAHAKVNGRVVLEPSAGEGALADACMAAGAKAVHCVELHSESASVLRGKGYHTHEGDFLYEAFDDLQLFDRIVMNPPFTKNQDIAHIRRALGQLADGGRLVAIAPQSTSRSAWVEMLRPYSHEWEELPPGSFKESGTNVNVGLLTVYG